jgi:hypothetical protein
LTWPGWGVEEAAEEGPGDWAKAGVAPAPSKIPAAVVATKTIETSERAMERFLCKGQTVGKLQEKHNSDTSSLRFKTRTGKMLHIRIVILEHL